MSPADPIADFNKALTGKTFATILADPPWRFQNRTGKMAPEHHRLSRYGTLTVDEIKALPVAGVSRHRASLSVGAERAARGRPGCAECLGLHLQDEPRVAQDPEGRRSGWTGRRLLFPERHRAGAVRREGQEREDAEARADAGQLPRHAETRAQPEAGRVLRHHPRLQPGPAPRTLRARNPPGLDGLGQPVGRPTTSTGIPTATTASVIATSPPAITRKGS